MKTATFYAKKTSRESGHYVEFEHLAQYKAYLSGIKDDTRLEIRIKKYVPKRSNAQNSFYWGVIVNMISDETGADADTVHSELKKRFLMIKDGVIPVVGSSKKLTTVEFSRYNDECVLFAAEWLGIIIPPPTYPSEH